MTANRAVKNRVRARMALTGESYTAALRHLRATEGAAMPTATATIRLAVAQTTSLHDPSDTAAMRARGAEIRSLMTRAADAGARLLQLPEAALCFPSKLLLSSVPGEVAESDWSRFDWATHDAEVAAIAAHARALRLWTVLGAPHRPSEPTPSGRPMLSLLAFDDGGAVVARYDERLLSRTKRSYMYEAGATGVTITVDGVTLGLISGLEGLFGDLVSDYEEAGADAVLYSTAGPADPGAERSLADSAAVAARQNGLWVGYAVHTDTAAAAPAGIIAPDGSWSARCRPLAEPDLVVTEVTSRPEGPGREWRREMLALHHERLHAAERG